MSISVQADISPKFGQTSKMASFIKNVGVSVYCFLAYKIGDSHCSDYPDYCHLERDVLEETAAFMFREQNKDKQRTPPKISNCIDLKMHCLFSGKG